MAGLQDTSVKESVAPAVSATSITNTNTTNTECRAVYVGFGDNYDFYIGGSWILFNNTADGSVLPIRATGARHNSGSSAPDSGDIVFLY